MTKKNEIKEGVKEIKVTRFKTLIMFLFVAQLLILTSMTLANIAPSNSLTRRSLAAHSSNVLEKRGISTVEEENEWLRENIELLKKLNRCPQTYYEAYAVLESLKGRFKGRPFSEDAWNDIDDTLLETTEDGDYKLSSGLKAARDAAFYNLDVAIKLIRMEKNQREIEIAKNYISRHGIEVVALQQLTNHKIVHLLQHLLQRTPSTPEDARGLLVGFHPFNLDTPMKSMLEKARKKLIDHVEGPWILVMLGCLNYMKARMLLDGKDLELWLRHNF
jgi:hypothetical protein